MSATWAAALGMAALLGLRHGLEADHLATIDGLSRAQPTRGPAAGLAFALGHGGVVLALCCALAVLGQQVVAPAWLAAFGRAVPVLALLLLAGANLHHGRPPRFVKRADSLGAACGVGALFALSLDAFATASLLASTALGLGAPAVGGAALLAGVFGAGMALTDGATGWFSARLLRAPGRRDHVCGVLVAGGCAATAALLLWAPELSPGWAWGWSAGVALLAPLAWWVGRSRSTG